MSSFKPGDVVRYTGEQDGKRVGVVSKIEDSKLWCCWGNGRDKWNDRLTWRDLNEGHIELHPNADRVLARYTKAILLGELTI